MWQRKEWEGVRKGRLTNAGGLRNHRGEGSDSH